MDKDLIKQWMEMIEYRITEGGAWHWNCFGSNAYRLEHWNGDVINGPGFSIVFDTQTQEVYQLEAYDYANNRAYQWIAPESESAYNAEAVRRNVDPTEAWDDVKFVKLDVVNDYFDKASAIYAGKEYDTRVTIVVDFTNEELVKYMTLAHERDMTFNQFIEEALKQVIKEYKNDPEGTKTRAERWSKSQ